ncbi:MAG: hypothetical protein ACREV1_12830, partial [Gammaproteobacteria bacterium]
PTGGLAVFLEARPQCHLFAHYRPRLYSVHLPIRSWTFAEVPLVKNGDWVNRLNGEDSVTDYLTNSYKLVGIFSLIESLAERDHQDFYKWLRSHCKKNNAFPIASAGALESLFNEHKRAHGATNHCVTFFERLSTEKQTALMQAIRIRGKPVSSIKRAIQVLYGLRSGFVHEANLLVHLSDRRVLSNLKGQSHLFDLSFLDFSKLFEEALIVHFAVIHNIPLQQTAKSFAFAVH